MASAVERSPPPFSRSQSTPDIFALSALDSPADGSSRPGNALDWNSWPGLPAFEVPSFNADFELDTSVFAHDRPSRPPPKPEAAALVEPDNLSRKPLMVRSKTVSLINRPRSWLSSSSRSNKDASTSDAQPGRPSSVVIDGDAAAAAVPSGSERTPSVPVTFANFARWSWTATSRSPSKHAKPPERLQLLTDADFNKLTKSSAGSESGKSTPKPVARASSLFAKRKPQPPPPVLTTGLHDGPDSDNSCASSMASVGQRASRSGKMSASQSTCSDGNTNTPITDESSAESTSSPLRDPFWSAFKSLDTDLGGFGSKPTSQRVGQIRSGLVPFLRTSMDHESVKSLCIKDIDRRAAVLNRCWVAILDMFYDRAQHPVPGMDRPVLLEAATLLMMRSEWRRATTYLQPLADRSPSERVRARSWTTTSGSSDHSHPSVLLAESAEHNVRSMFISNLVKQMGYVDKMSVRHAPLSLVNFSAKTCAYAFFAPGVADILVRLWSLTPELIRRAADGLDLPRKDGGESDDIVALFPPKLGPFGWTSARAMWDMLKQIPRISLLVARISWTGPWVSRWKGRDTDLFFIFCKYFHVLSSQFMPPGLPLREKARSPAFVLVYAQLLSIIDTTIHRQMAIEHAYGPPLIDSVNGPDATTMSIPLPPTNLMKGMSENGLVVLLRDFLADEAPEMTTARHTFAEAFAHLIKAATYKTSQFDSAACFTLCDLLEEVIAIYHDLECRGGPSAYLDWAFVLEVCKRVLGTLNTMSEVRMLSLIYSIWDAATKDPRRKATLCLDWLLTEETFDAFFNNWCPMVRAYYQRLLCWRICRDDGNSDEVDLNVMFAASARLRTVWSHYLFLKRNAEEAGRSAPSTIPMYPALGKKFMVVRQEVSTPQPGLMAGFDTFARLHCSDGQSGGGYTDTPLLGKADSKKRWSLLGRVLSMTTGNGAGGPPPSGPEGVSRSPLPEGDSPTARRAALDLPARAVPPPLTLPSSTAKSGTKSAAASEPDSLGSSPVLDEQKYSFKFVLGFHQQSTPTAGRDLTRPKLPAPAQSQVAARCRDGGSVTAAGTLRPEARRPAGPEVSGAAAPRQRPSSINASVEEWLRATSMETTMGQGNEHWSVSGPVASDQRFGSAGETRRWPAKSWAPERQETARERLIKAVKPTGVFARNTVYSGRALAEWAHVVAEYNSFVERRREEGVGRLGDVEVPLLGVEGFRKIGG